MNQPRRKKIRLPPSSYERTGEVFSVTICCRDHLPLLAGEVEAHTVQQSVSEGRFPALVDLYAYAIMPDHVHLLVGVKGDNPVRVLQRWKSYAGSLLRGFGIENPVWQRSFYDHGIRRKEDLEAAAVYIVQNPFRAGLPDRHRFAWHRWMSDGRTQRSAPTET